MEEGAAQPARRSSGGGLAHAIGLGGRSLALGRPGFPGFGGARARTRQRSSLGAQPAGKPPQGLAQTLEQNPTPTETLGVPAGAPGAAIADRNGSSLHAGPSAEATRLFRRRLRLEESEVEEAGAGQTLQASRPAATLEWAIDRAALLFSMSSLGSRSRRGSKAHTSAAAPPPAEAATGERASPGAGTLPKGLWLSTEATLAGTAQTLSERMATWPPQGAFARWSPAPSGSVTHGAAAEAQTLAVRAATLAAAAEAPAQPLSDRLRTWPQDGSARDAATQTRARARGNSRY